MKRILITGITGFVGNNLVNYLSDRDDIGIIGQSRDVVKAKQLLRDIEFISETKPIHLDRYLIDTIIHLAGIAHDVSGKYKKEDYLEHNYQSTLALYDNFIKSNARKFVFVSSVKAVVDHTNETIDENFRAEPTSDYGKSKYLAEQHILANQKNNKQSYILRPTMIHGPGNKGNLNLLYKFVKSGMPYPLAAFDNKRSFLSVENFCFVINEIIQDRLAVGAYLLADNECISTKDLIKLIADVSKSKSRSFAIPRSLVRAVAKIGSLVNAPFNSQILDKLAGDMIVSNNKLLLNLEKQLPVSTREGLIKTIRSFNE